MNWRSIFNFKQESAAPDSRPAYTTLQPYSSYRSWLWNQYRQQDTRIDYASEVGALEASSLFMAVVNFIGLQMPKANPALCTEVNGEQSFDYEADIVKLIRNPNPYFIWADYVQAAAVAIFDDGNCYLKKVHDAGGRVSELWYLPYQLVEPRFLGDHKSPDLPEDEIDDSNRFLSHFQYGAPGANPVLYRADDIVHLKRGIDNNFPQKGVGVFRPLVKEVYGDNAAALFTATIMRNMGRVPFVFSPKNKDDSLTQVQAEAFKEQWIKGTTGDNAGNPMVNTIPLEYSQPGFNPQELDLSGMRKMFESRVSAVSNIPAPVLQFLVGQENGTSYASYEQARKQAWESVIIPLLTQMQERLTFQLGDDFNFKENQYLEFVTDEVPELQADENALHKRAKDALTSGGITLGEYYSMLGMDLDDETLKDIRYIPSVLTPKTTEQILEPPQQPPPMTSDPQALAEFAKMERWFEALESEMAAFKPQ